VAEPMLGFKRNYWSKEIAN